MIDLKENVISTINKHKMLVNGEKIVVGVSGGADSVALLHTLWEISPVFNISLVVVHINHGIRGKEALRDEKYVQNICEKLNIEYICKHIDVPKIANDNKISLELAGRKARYDIFYQILNEKNAHKIAVAHNKNDSVETIIMKLSRGAGLNGLKGISPINNIIIRPLIECERSEIEHYLSINNIDFMTDSTNDTDDYTRNLVRNKILPLMKTINPNVINTIFLNSQSLNDDDDYINAKVNEYAKKYIVSDDVNVYLDMKNITHLHSAIKNRLIIKAFNTLTGSRQNIEQKHISILLNSRSPGKKYYIGSDVIVTKDYDKLIFSKEEETNIGFKYDITDLTPVCHENLCINFSLTVNNDICDKNSIYINYDLLKNKNLFIRNALPGDKFIPSGMTNEKKINRFFIDNKVSKHKRSHIPLLCTDTDIVAVLGMRVSEKYIINNSTNEILKITISGGNHE